MILPQGNAWGKLRGKLSTTPEQALNEWGFPQSEEASGIVFREYRYLNDSNKLKTGTFVSNYIPPANPRTTCQQAMRHHFGVISKMALTHIDDLIKPIWSQLKTEMDACNLFRSVNLRLTRKSYDYTRLRISDGDLEPCHSLDSYSYEANRLRVNFSSYSGPQGRTSDIVNIYIYIKSTEQLFSVSGNTTYTRADGTFLSQDDFFISLTNIIVFIFFTNYIA